MSKHLHADLESFAITVSGQGEIFCSWLKSAFDLLHSRRKRGEKGEVVETIEDVIVRRLTTERIEELKKLLRDTQEQYRYIHT